MQTSSTTIHADKSDISQRHLVVVQCRYNSTRLSGKAMMIWCGIPMLSFLLKRLKAGLPEDSFKIILATTKVPADNPFTCPEVIECAVNEMIKRKVGYLKCENLPEGSGVDLFSANLLRQLGVKAKEPQEREHINMYVLNNMEKYTTYFL